MPRTAKLPTSVTTAAILLMIYGGLTIGCFTCSTASLFLDDGMNERLEKEIPAYFVVELGTSIVNLITATGLVTCGIFLLRLTPLARLAAYVFCTLDILVTFAHSVYAGIWLIPVQNRILAEEAENMPPMGFDFANVMNTSMWFGVGLNMLITLTICLTAICLLSSASARAAFAAGYLEPAQEDKPDRYRGYDSEDDYYPRRAPPEDGFTERP